MTDDYTPREMRLIAERDAALSRAEIAEGNVALLLTTGRREIEALRGERDDLRQQLDHLEACPQRMSRERALDVAAWFCAASNDSDPDISVEVGRGRHVLIREWVIRAIMEASAGG